MIVAVFKFVANVDMETKTVLANTMEEAEDYVRTIARNGTYKVHNLNIIHSYAAGTPTTFKVKKRDDNGFPSLIEWRDSKGNSGTVREWTELPSRIKKFKTPLGAKE